MRRCVIAAVLLIALTSHAQADTETECTWRFSELPALVASDQAARKALIGATEAEIKDRWPSVEAIDRANTIVLSEVLRLCGWPKDRKSSHEAWLLAQHADHDLPFQQVALALLRASVASGIASPSDLAHFEDRVALDPVVRSFTEPN